jgi:hypothetical protein
VDVRSLWNFWRYHAAQPRCPLCSCCAYIDVEFEETTGDTNL